LRIRNIGEGLNGRVPITYKAQHSHHGREKENKIPVP